MNDPEATPYWKLDSAYQGYLPETVEYGNGTSTVLAYVPANGRVQQISTTDGPGAIFGVRTLDYGYDRNGNTEWTLDRSGDGADLTHSRIFGYDELNRLDREWAVASIGSEPNKGELLRAISYTPAGDIDGMDGIGAYSYDDKPHAVTAAGDNEYGYDELGRQETRTGPNVVGGTQIVTYTHFDLPESLQLGEEGVGALLSFEYDGNHARTIKRVDNNIPGTATLETLYAGSYERRDEPDGGRVHSYLISAGGAPIGRLVQREEDGELVGDLEVSFVHPDKLGSLSLVTDASGAPDIRRFDPFGVSEASVLSPDNKGFTGHEHDTEAGIVNMGGRLYDPALGRFLSPDPLIGSMTSSESLNPYSYARNNPLKFVDPSGFQACIGDEQCQDLPAGFGIEFDDLDGDGYHDDPILSYDIISDAYGYNFSATVNGRTGAASASTTLGGSSIANTSTIVVPGQQGTSHAVHITEREPSAFAQYHVWVQSNPGSATSFPTSSANPFLLEPPKLNLFAPTTPSTFTQLAYPQRPGQTYWLPPPPNDIAVLADPLQSPEAKRDAAMRLAVDVYLSVMGEGALGVIMSRAAAAASRLALRAEARAFGELVEMESNIVGRGGHRGPQPTQFEIHPDIVADYEQKLTIQSLGGPRVKPIEVVELPDGRQFLIEGHHRYVASQRTGIPVDIHVTPGEGPVGFGWDRTYYDRFVIDDR